MKLIEYDSSFDDDQKKQAKALKISCNLNMAACKLKLKDYREVVKMTTKVGCLEKFFELYVFKLYHCFLQISHRSK